MIVLRVSHVGIEFLFLKYDVKFKTQHDVSIINFNFHQTLRIIVQPLRDIIHYTINNRSRALYPSTMGEHLANLHTKSTQPDCHPPPPQRVPRQSRRADPCDRRLTAPDIFWDWVVSA